MAVDHGRLFACLPPWHYNRLMSIFKTRWPGIMGHEWAVDLLSGALANDRLAHAYLLSGPAFIGKTTLARVFAQALNCGAGDSEPCLACRSCQLIANDGHPDVRLIEPVLSSSGRTETLRIDQVRGLQRELALSPYEGRYRVAIMTRFQQASPGAANALLKTLEEPPERVVLVLTADSGRPLLPTIVSRCQPLALRPLPLEKVESALLLHWHATEGQANQLAHLSGGRLGLAVRLLTDSHLLDRRGERLDAMEALLGEDRAARFRYVEGLTRTKQGTMVREVLELWSGWWRDVMLTAAWKMRSAPITNVDRKDQIQAAANRYGIESARAVVRSIQETLGQLDRNANTRLALEVLMLSLPYR
jgi:DNA polymerase-3 subunit delta'